MGLLPIRLPLLKWKLNENGCLIINYVVIELENIFFVFFVASNHKILCVFGREKINGKEKFLFVMKFFLSLFLL